jgi:hypothetical protein
MIIHDLNLEGITIVPAEADAPLIIDANAPLTSAIADEPFEAVGRRNPQVFNGRGPVQHPQLAKCDRLNGLREPPRWPQLENPASFFAAKGADHGCSI